MKVAYFGFPHIGGTYSVYRHLRQGLSEAGIDVHWLGLGQQAVEALSDPMWGSERHHGHAIVGDASDERSCARSMIDFLEGENFDGVFVNVLTDRIQTNAIRYMPSSILRIMIVHNITPGTYAAARGIRDWVHETVCVSPRIRSDLVKNFGFDPNRTTTVLNGVDLRDPMPRLPGASASDFRLLFVGRIEDQAKGVMWLPSILKQLPPSVTLTVAGAGPDSEKLERALASFGSRVRFLGAVSPEAVRELFSTHDALIMPSRFEGLPVTLVEAMASGCVPIASKIRGVTDAIVEDGLNGMLFPVGNAKVAARQILLLVKDRERFSTMRAQAQKTASSGFGVAHMAALYRKIIESLAVDRPAIADPLPLEEWSVPSQLRSGLRTYLPVPLKNFLRTFRERLPA